MILETKINFKEINNLELSQFLKHFIYFQHLLVGLTEDMDSFVKMLELLLPQFFEGSYDLFHDETKNLNHVRRTKHKDPVKIMNIIIFYLLPFLNKTILLIRL